MTAEVALLNRSALALAADSAVTIRSGRSLKIYDSAEKIFELSRKQPIALMIYNNVDHVGVPLDVLIRKYRSECKKNFDTIIDSAIDFLLYLENCEHHIDEEKNFLRSILHGEFDFINSLFYRAIRKIGDRNARSMRSFSPIAELERVIDLRIENFQSQPLEGYLEDVDLEKFEELFGEVVDQIGSMMISLKTTKNIEKKLRNLAFAMVKSKEPSGNQTGLVFGGFGAKDLFPTLYSLEVDGVFFGKLKRFQADLVDIDRNGDRAQIVPFAQKDMADRFIYGLDEAIQRKIANYAVRIIDEVVKTKPRSFKKQEAEGIKKKVRDNFDDLLTKMRDLERKNILDILDFMSKKELGEMAHAIVELTSKKRRFSFDQETVGGPIDVAIVTRNEGFIWIKRKHYFERGQNPGYYARVYGEEGGRTDGA